MSRNQSGLIILILFIFNQSIGQIPHITGKINVSVKSGTLDADLILSNLPKTDNYTIWLNTGLNIEYFRDINDQFNFSYNTEYNSELSSESLQHYFPSSDQKSRFLPNGFQVKYTGKFPVIADTTKAYEWGDWKGNIAFNGKTLRTSEQSAWYPIIYDKTNEVVIDKYTFKLDIACNDCETLYLNGNAPVTGNKASFESQEAVPLLMFLGDYEFKKDNNIFVLNAALNTDKLNTLTRTTNQIIRFYERILKMPYGKPVVYISTTPVSRKNEWMFVTYPTIAVVGINQYKLDNYFDNKTFEFKQKSNITFIAHELAHYYFGTVFVPNSELRWFFLEGLTDYLSIKAAKELLGNETYQLIVKNYTDETKDFKPVPLDQIKIAGEINETYRYRFIPLLLLAMEAEIGETKMYEWIRNLTTIKNEKTNYAFFIKSFQKVGISEKEIQTLIDAFFNNTASKQSVME